MRSRIEGCQSLCLPQECCTVTLRPTSVSSQRRPRAKSYPYGALNSGFEGKCIRRTMEFAGLFPRTRDFSTGAVKLEREVHPRAARAAFVTRHE